MSERAPRAHQARCGRGDPNWYLDEGRRLCADVDRKDAPFVTLALHLDGLIWTDDAKLAAGLRAKGSIDFSHPEIDERFILPVENVIRLALALFSLKQAQLLNAAICMRRDKTRSQTAAEGAQSAVQPSKSTSSNL